jgi:hypothetical protein
MGMLGQAEKVRSAVKATVPVRLVAVLAGGSLGQRAVATIGLAVVVFAVLKCLTWVALVVGGWILVYFAIRDYERSQEQP